MKHSVSVTCCALLVSSISLSYAAEVPSGTVLAEKQELVRHIKDEPASLDPAKAVGLPEIQVIRDLFEGLVNQNEKGEIVPGVATQWKSNDNRIWTFTLRDNAKWADGTPVTAQDFVYSWQRLVDPKTLSPFAWFAALAGINNAQAIIDGKATPDQLGVTAVDAHTLKIQLDKPLPWFVNLTANFAFFPVQKANVESSKEWTKPGNLIGNGAYVLKERVVNEKLVVVPNTHYWDNAKTVLQKVTFLPINQESAATKRYLAGDIDITESFPKNMYQKLLKDIPGQVASMWKKNLGVDVKLQNQEWKTYIDSRNTGNFDVIRASWVGDYNEPSTFLTLLTSTHSGNISRFNNPAYDKVLAQASTENTVKARNADYNAAEKILMEQAPIAPIYQYTNGRLIKPWLKGYPINNPEDVAYSRTMYIVKH
ncbi:TPA: peptide ABC transporter substrate-binding protein [Escherichia coli]|nr:peptide ABC transporter substrate-binding protein [Escherichia coli]